MKFFKHFNVVFLGLISFLGFVAFIILMLVTIAVAGGTNVICGTLLAVRKALKVDTIQKLLRQLFNK